MLKRIIPDRSRNSLSNPEPLACGYLRVKPIKGALETLQSLARNGFPVIHIVSRVSAEKPFLLRRCRWLSTHGFNSVVPVKRVHFCYERSDKAAICEKLGISHFVDDRLSVLQHLITVVPFLFLFGGIKEEERALGLQFLVNSGRVIVVRSWYDIYVRLIAS